VKPTPSIFTPQRSVDLASIAETTMQIKGRHDPCIVPRAVPVVEAAAAIAIYDLILMNTQTNRRKT
jgi:chorismate synthase